MTVRIEAQTPVGIPPSWALLMRRLFDAIEDAAPQVFERYTHPDGRLLWPPSPDFQSIDALDDCYESFHNWPLFYLLGGSTWFLTEADRAFDVINAQMSQHGSGHGYSMVVDEYQPGYDWFHQGEGNYLFYMLCMADPTNVRHVDRARRFAEYFTGQNPDVPNYDSDLRLIRCARNGSKGPAYWAFDEGPHWPYPGYNLPFYDVPGCPNHAAVEADPQRAEQMGAAMRERMGRGDAVINLLATTLGANAFMLTGDSTYRDWAVEYTEAWMARTEVNGGIVPDNVGLSGSIGEHLSGKWYGSMYGWAWPHGWHSVGQAVGVAAQNCALLTRRLDYMDFLRSQIDALIARGIDHNDQLHVPHKYDDPGRVDYEPGAWLVYPICTDEGTALQRDGWFEFMPMYPSDIAHLWCMTMEEDDAQRFEQTRKRSGDPFALNAWHHAKDQGGHDWGWMAYLRGAFPDYPERILQHNLEQVQARLQFMAEDDQDPATYNDAYFQRRNPVTCEGLVQLTMGAPLPHYNGGLLVGRLRYFDCQRQRPGLPPDVAALVSSLSENGCEVTLINLSETEERAVLIQAGAMGEHRFTDVLVDVMTPIAVNAPTLTVSLPPRTKVRLQPGMERFVDEPSFAWPL